MRLKTSVTLPGELLRSLDEVGGGRNNRSRLVEQAVREWVERRLRDVRDARDREILDRHADHLNDEAADVLGYQVKI
jgi:metal-responsive CopG/Arc/MetJ family transcriptional regulator